MRRSKFDPPRYIVPRLKKALIQRDRKAYRREVLGIPGPIDKWLAANSGSDCPNSEVLTGLSMGKDLMDLVTCTVHRFCIQVSHRFEPDYSIGPIIILLGSLERRDLPGWTRYTHPLHYSFCIYRHSSCATTHQSTSNS